MKIEEGEKVETNQNNLVQGFYQFCQQTSLHGWNYIQSESGIIRKTVWFILILFHYVIATVFIWKNFQEYSSATTITTIQSTTASLDEITFPSLYICNLNQFTRSFMANVGVGEDVEEHAIVLLQRELISGSFAELTPEDQAFVDKIQEKMADVYDYHNKSHIFDISGQDCSDMLLKVTWSNQSVKLFYSAFRMSTEYGMCCMITPNLDFNPNEQTKDYSSSQFYDIQRGFAKDGMSHGLQVTLDMEHYDHAMILDSIGFKMGLSDARDKMMVGNQGFNIQPGVLTEVAVTPTILNTTPQAIYDFSPEERNCYVDSEFEFKYLIPEDGFRYSIENCFYEALLQRIVSDCQCIHYLDFNIVKRSHPELEVCKGSEKLHCANNLLLAMGNENLGMNYALNVHGKSQKCLQRCEVQHNEFILSQLIYPHTQTFKFHSDVCLITEKIDRICNNPSKRLTFEKYYQNEMNCKEFLECFDFDSHYQKCDGETNSQFTHTHQNHTKLFKFLQKYATENVAKVKIFLRNSFYTKIKKDVQISFVDFVSNTGGLLGLCLGLSIISIFEFIYHCFKCVSKKYVNLNQNLE